MPLKAKKKPLEINKWLINKHWGIFKKQIEKHLEKKDFELGEILKSEITNLKRGSFITYLTEISKGENKVGLIYQVSISSHRKALTHELGYHMPLVQLSYCEYYKKYNNKFILLTDITTSTFDGMMTESFKKIEKVRRVDDLNLIINIVVLPKKLSSDIMKFYSRKVERVIGFEDIHEAIEKMLSYL